MARLLQQTYNFYNRFCICQPYRVGLGLGLV